MIRFQPFLSSASAQVNPVSSSAAERGDNCDHGGPAVPRQRPVPQWRYHWFLPQVSDPCSKKSLWINSQPVKRGTSFDFFAFINAGTSCTRLLPLLPSALTSSAASSISSWHGGTMQAKAASRTRKWRRQKRTTKTAFRNWDFSDTSVKIRLCDGMHCLQEENTSLCHVFSASFHLLDDNKHLSIKCHKWQHFSSLVNMLF